MAFTSAKKIGTAPAAPKGKGTEREAIELPNIEQLAQLHAIMRLCKGAIAAIEGTMKDDVFDNIFMPKIKETGMKPASVDAVEGLARVNVQFKKRAITSPFSLEEMRDLAVAAGEKNIPEEVTMEQLAKMLAKHKLVVGENVKTQKLFAIDPEKAVDEALMKKVETVLQRNGLGDIIVVQDEVKTYVVTDELLKTACEKRNADIIDPMVVIGAKPTLTEVKPESLAKLIGELLDIDVKVGSDDKKFTETVVKAAKAKAAKVRKTPALEKA